ncbi:MAG: permease [Candidatus Cloacimonetes bacterium]|nr:permease [Candidatus Cloacimonadota bacterium]
MNSVTILAIFTGVSLLLSAIFDKKKTGMALKKGIAMFINLLLPFATILIFVSTFLYLIPDKLIIQWLGKDAGISGMVIAAVVGSISLIPGFIAYPLGGILIKNGAGYPVIAIFITTLMMVGIITLPIEFKYFGKKIALLRNLLSFIGAIIVGLLMGLLWGLI